MSLNERFKNSTIAVVAGGIILFASGLTAVEKTTNIIDKSFVTERELALHADTAHPKAILAIARSELKSECRWLKSEIRNITDRIRELTTAGADPAWISEKQVELDELQSRWDSKGCASVDYI